MPADRIYIDTRPGTRGVFSAPPDVTDYKAWLLRRYWQGEGHDVVIQGTAYKQSLGGVNQAVNAAIHAGRNGARLTFIGPYSHQARDAIVLIARTKTPDKGRAE